MIPKRIFYVWGVNDPKKRDVLACMQSWRQVCSDYEIIEINEKSKKYFNFQKELENNKWFKTVYERKMWAYVADYVRIKTLYENGGIYLDTDVTVIKKFDEFLNDSAFVGMQRNNIELDEDYVEPAILGAQKGNKFLKNILDFYEDGIWKEPIFTMPQIFQKFLNLENCKSFGAKSEQNIIRLNDIVVYPEKYFIPFRYQEEFSPECVEKETHTIHWFGGSWVNPGVLFFLMNKHLPNQQLKDANKKLQNIWRLKIFKLIPLLKIVIQESKINVYLFNFIKIIRIEKNRVFLFGIIPFINIKNKRVFK